MAVPKLGSDWLWIAAGIGVLMVVKNVNDHGLFTVFTGSEKDVVTGQPSSLQGTSSPLGALLGWNDFKLW